MAVPADFTTLNCTGRFQLNKSLSDDADEVLKEQGISWIIRKAIAVASVYLDLTHYKDDNGVEHIDSTASISGGIAGKDETNTLDWKEVEIKTQIYSPAIGKIKRTRVEEIEIEYLARGWTEDTVEHGVIIKRIESDTPKSKTTWTSNQTWGVEEVNGERRSVFRLHFVGPTGNISERRYVYDYRGPL